MPISFASLPIFPSAVSRSTMGDSSRDWNLRIESPISYSLLDHSLLPMILSSFSRIVPPLFQKLRNNKVTLIPHGRRGDPPGLIKSKWVCQKLRDIIVIQGNL